MTTLLTDLFPARARPANGVFRRGLARLAARLAKRRRHEATTRDLAHLGDRALRDVGLSRDDLAGASRQAALDAALRLRPFP